MKKYWLKLICLFARSEGLALYKADIQSFENTKYQKKTMSYNIGHLPFLPTMCQNILLTLMRDCNGSPVTTAISETTTKEPQTG